MTLKCHSRIVSKLLQKNVQIPLQKHPWSIGKMGLKGIFATHLNKTWNISVPFYLSIRFTTDFSWGGEHICGNCTYSGKTQKPSIHCKSVHTLLV